MPTVMIIGASRGIGLELVRQFATDGWRVHATTRTPDRRGWPAAAKPDAGITARNVSIGNSALRSDKHTHCKICFW